MYFIEINNGQGYIFSDIRSSHEHEPFVIQCSSVSIEIIILPYLIHKEMSKSKA